jgi:LytR cell envelope-related transcriptional attenuator
LIAALLVALGGMAMLLAPTPRVQVEDHAYPIPSPDHRVVVEVLNGTRRQGAARVATRMLRRRGLDVVFFGNADAPADSTRIVVRRGDPARGREVRGALGVGRIVVEPDTLRRVDVSVILGRDFRPKVGLLP